MSLAAGSRLGPYEVIALVGSGGMGEVYRGRDTRLDRTVAIKVLHSHLSAQPTVRERFEREARAVSALNHPHICVLHDIGKQDDVEFIVMEFVEGESAGQRLSRGPLPLIQALKYASEIADALDKAHRHGITHRDLKPTNIMITKSGAKLLDFGLAKLRGTTSAPVSISVTALPVDHELTGQGAILGTLQYMSPEQLQGKEADHRTDIFALGAVLHEMITGEKAFRGKTQVSLMASILESDPAAVSSLMPAMDPVVDRVVHKCLNKDPEERWQSAHDLKDELNWISETRLTAPPPQAPATRLKPGLAWGVFVVAMIVAAAFAVLYYTRNAQPERLTASFQIFPQQNSMFSPAPADLSISPDGRLVVFGALDSNGNQLLWVRPIDSMDAHRLPGTEDAFSPFWSPDSRQIAFFAKGKLQRISLAGVTGGSPQPIGDAPDGRGGTWNNDDVIVFARNLTGTLYRVSAKGGIQTPLTKLDPKGEESGNVWPQFLPDGDHYLYLAWSPKKDKRQIRMGSLAKPGEASMILKAESNVAFALGRLIFSSNGELLSQPFDLKLLKTLGEPSLIVEDVWSNPATGRASFAVSQSGTLVYRNGANFDTTQLVLRDRNGKELKRFGNSAGAYGNPGVSQDGRRIAFDWLDDKQGVRNISIFDLERSTPERVTFGASIDSSPILSRDGIQMLFLSNRGAPGVYRISFGDGGGEEKVFESEEIHELLDWSAAHQAVIFEKVGATTKGDIWVYSLSSRSPMPFLNSAADEIHGQLSPDGKWLAYASDETGRYEVYVERFPERGARRQITTDGGMQPRWSPDRREIYYLAPDRMLKVARFTSEPSFNAEEPHNVFQTDIYGPSIVRSRNNYVPGKTGDTFIINSIVDSKQPIKVVVGWNPQ